MKKIVPSILGEAQLMKFVKAVQPYIYEGKINFKHKPYDAWEKLGGQVAESHYPWRPFHRIVYGNDFPVFAQKNNEARLRFVQPYSLTFDTWPDYMFYEIIPFFWDCWPDNFEKVFAWLKRHKIRTAIFTSSQFADMVRVRFPKMNVLAVTEGIDIEPYKMGKKLCERGTDFLQYGREIDSIVRYDFSDIRYVSGKENGTIVFTQEQLYDAIADARVVAAYPKSWTNPEEAGEIETLTQRYWECMLSRCVMVGHAPKELVELIGYNPVIELDKDNPNGQVHDILEHINDYQGLVDKNRGTALKYGDWKYSIVKVMKWLSI